MKRGILTTILKFFGIGLSLTSIVLLSQKYSLVEAGIYSLVIYMVNIFSLIQSFGKTNSVYLNIQKSLKFSAKELNYIGESNSILLFSSIVTALLLLIFKEYLYEYLFDRQVSTWIIGLIFLSSKRSFVLEIFRIKMSSELTEIMKSILVPLTTIVLVNYVDFNDIFLALFILFASTITVCSLLLLNKYGVNINLLSNAVLSIEVVEWNFYKSGLLSIMSTSGLIVFLRLFVSLENIAIFDFGYKVAMLSSVVMLTLNQVYSSDIARFYKHNQISLILDYGKKIARLTFIANLIFLVLAVFIGEELIETLNSRYLLSYDIIIILSLGGTISALCGPVGMILNMTGSSNEVLRVSIYSTPLLYLSIPILIQLKGIEMAALGLSIVTVFINIYLWVKVKMNLRISLSI